MVNEEKYIEHSPNFNDNLTELKSSLFHSSDDRTVSIEYKRSHRILAEGNFVLSVCEGYVNQIHSSFYDLYRLKTGKIVDHWDTREAIPTRIEWKNTF